MKKNLRKSIKVVYLVVVASIVFSCNFNSTPNLGNDNFKLNGSVNSANNNSPYAFTGALNRTDGNPVTGPLPTPIPPPIQIQETTKQIYNASLFAGSPTGIAGVQNGQGANALFSFPQKLFFDSKNNLFVLDQYLTIRKIAPDGTVSQVMINTFDGVTVNVPINAKAFTMDSADNMYVAKGGTIFKMTPDGVATTIYSTYSGPTTPYTNISNPNGIALDKIAVDQAQNVYFTDSFEQLVKKVSVTGNISFVAGRSYATTAIDGNGANATFELPWDIISDNTGNFYVADAFAGKIRKIDPQNNVTTFSGKGTYGTFDTILEHWNAIDGTKDNAEFGSVGYIAFDNNNNILLSEGDKIRKVDPQGNVETLIINNNDTYLKQKDYLHGNLLNGFGIAINKNGDIYVSDSFRNRIIKLTPSTITIPKPKDNKVYYTSTIAGSGTRNTINGQGQSASFFYPYKLAFKESTSELFVSELDRGIRKIDSQNNVTTFSTLYGGYDISINNGDINVSINNYIRKLNPDGSLDPNDIKDIIGKNFLKDNSGNIYSTDSIWNVIRKNSLFDVFAGTQGTYNSYGFQDGGVGTAMFNNPNCMVIDSTGNIYVADTFNNSIRKITPNGNTTTLAGSSFEGYKDGNGSEARFRHPYSIAIDKLDYIYVADMGNNRIRKISPTGDVWTIAGSGAHGFADGLHTNSIFNQPVGITVDLAGNVYVADNNNFRIRKLTPQ